MAEPVGDLVVDLSLDAARFDEQMARVRRHFSGTESDAKKTAAVVEQSLSRQALAAQKAGISVGQYKAAMRMLPAQFTDVATQLAGGQSPWLILLQQGGQVKDSFGGMIPMFRGLAGAITLPMVGATSLAVATGALAYAWYQGNSTLSDFNKTLVLSGNQAGLTADRMLVLSRAGQAAGLTFNQTSESLSALVKAGVSGEAQIASISQSVARFSSVSGVEVDKVAEAFGKLTTDPTSGLTAMARQFHNVTAEQIAYVAQLQRSGDEAGALQAANEAATKGFDDQTRRLKENMGTLETWADRTARAFKSMWDAVLDIGRPDTAQEMLIKAETAFKKADDIWNLRKDDYFVNDEARARYWDDREKARLALEAARKKAEQQTQQDKNAQQQSDTEASRLKYTEEAQKAYERLQTPLEKYTARQEELNKALKDGKILQADYNTLMAAAKKDYEATLKKPKQSGVKVSAGDRQEDSAHAALLTLQAELRTLEKHAGANEKISQQRRDLWKAESQFAVLEEAAQRRQLSAQEKSLLAHKDETLEYKRQLAALGDKVTYQERLNALAQQADKFAQQQRAKRAAIDAKSRGLTDRQAERETTSKGDRNPSEVRLLVQIQRNGGWVTEKDITIKGKTTSQYLASVVVGNLPPRPFNIRMRRMTPDSTTDQLQNKTLWSSYTEIIDVKQCYPNTALVGVQVDSEQFGSQQVSRNYHLRGRILQVPSNYNPQTRQYSGIWDGTFKPAYSNNMAWCLWDMLTHPRYGMGKRLGAADVDKWALYVIGQHCEQSVPDGFGGTEPRITCNAYLTTQRKAWDVLSDFCSAMRCMPVWNGQTLTFVQDRPSDKVWTYNRSNVVMPDDGAPFRYSFSALKDRHNAVEVNWIDPNNGWETATELVEDTQAIARYGRNVTKMDAFGCTSRGQAHRAGLWLIKTELLETQTVDFSVGAEGLRHVPGDVIEICDDDYAGISIGGRVLAVNSQTRTLTLDREITLPASGTTLISLVDGQGSPVSVEVQSVRGDFVKAVSKAFPKKVGTWGNTETPNGTVTVTISDDHNFDRQIIIPPIIFNGIAYDDPGSGNNPGGTRYTGYGFEVRKNGVLIASRETKGAIPGSYSAVIDMPSGGGSVTLEFKIFQKGNQGAGNITDCTVIVTKKAASGISIR
ncbi:phage tail tip domain-containing protein [Escherichia coli]|uniref:phage tail tip domain-containing protein n=1 Tax=Escherichia coli TaxID=562 RepID=UPI003F54ADE5